MLCVASHSGQDMGQRPTRVHERMRLQLPCKQKSTRHTRGSAAPLSKSQLTEGGEQGTASPHRCLRLRPAAPLLPQAWQCCPALVGSTRTRLHSMTTARQSMSPHGASTTTGGLSPEATGPRACMQTCSIFPKRACKHSRHSCSPGIHPWAASHRSWR